ncbi:YjjW family glycine radical enzyme activase [Romboutsia hominis]|uniref:Glycine radical enzyme activase, YjjW n=1 Tax=Romboutsia hominis TaxID=1507512 RepID=A0A2P2BRT1_9FIRM|nr:YjjW family glycine radical enzyme activase [Romboutsia hominis]MCH1960350.1 YjjW family glycine radical enzyme activase [Romboutsia hominis]MCH1969218.1 YjjW family glycine radical enzyme activase [Romboutsia hominis]CEI73067.1 Glycine radical enzyme activase, YjjW [Romboutsia hominis]
MALVNKIIPFSCIDGPGNRTAIFFQGCNFKCTYCHNPETINKCINCGKCISTCKVDALFKIDNKVIWDDKKCIGCDDCIKACDNLSSPKTKDYSVDKLFEEIKEISPFIQGITVSGGECTLNSDFLVKLFKKVKYELNLTCFIDTNGSIDLTEHKELVDLTDKFMLDVKSIDEYEHIKLTGVSNDIVLKNLKYLLSIEKLYEVRTVIAPNLNNEETVIEVSKIIKDKCKYKFNAYRKYGVRKEGLDFHGEVGPNEEEINNFIELRKSIANNL